MRFNECPHHVQSARFAGVDGPFADLEGRHAEG